MSIDRDPKTGGQPTYSLFNQFKTSDQFMLIGNNEGSSLNTSFWDLTVANGGTGVASNNILTLATETTANGSAIVQSKKNADFVPHCTNSFLCHFKLGDTGATDNVRRWGVFDANNGLFWQLNGTTAAIVYRELPSLLPININ